MQLEMTPQIQRATLNGMNGELSTLIVGCDNKNTLEEAAPLWDAWWEAGGNAFDSAFVYGKGLHEQVLGQWMRSRGVSKEAKVIVKGAHTPNCLPGKIAEQLEISLERLGLDHAPVYIMHRDNLDVPVGEFVDALNALVDQGLLGALGGSNWTVERFKEAGAYAEAHGLRPLSILNNNLGSGVDTLVAAARELPQLITLCGIKSEQEAVDFPGRRLDPGDAKLLTFDLSRNQTIKTLK